MDKQQKSDASCGRSTSSSSRRVMWKMDTPNKDEEVFDSVVTYRWMPAEVTVSTKKSKSNPEIAGKREVGNKNWRLLVTELVKQKDLTELELPTTSRAAIHKSNSLAKLDAKARAKIYWQHLFNKIVKQERVKKMVIPEEEEEEEKDIPLSGSSSLALRYKPSHESLKYKKSKDRGLNKDLQVPSTSQEAAASLKIETCDLPPHQTCVVREPPPMFAHRVRISMSNDTDSCSSAELDAQRNGTASDGSSLAGLSKHLLSVVIASDPQVAAKRDTLKRTVKRTSSGRAQSLSVSGKKLTTQSNSGMAGVSTSEAAKPLNRTSGSSTARSTSEPGKNSNTATGSVVPNLRQRQLELHHYRVLIEKRRLSLLELKIAREREESLHQDILFHKDLQIKENLLKSYEENNVSHA